MTKTFRGPLVLTEVAKLESFRNRCWYNGGLVQCASMAAITADLSTVNFYCNFRNSLRNNPDSFARSNICQLQCDHSSWFLLPLNVQVKLRNAVYLYPMQKRVTELTYILQECSMKDVQIIFPFLVEHIFGVNPSFGNGWNLLGTSRTSNCGDFDALYTFLHPFGTLFEIIYKLLGDVYSKYEYPITLLPQRLRQMILDGSVPQFFVDKLQIDPNFRAPTALVLNSFEFYLFHFAFHLLNSWHDQENLKVNCDTIYLHLSDQYLQHFLPIETSVVLPIVPIHQAISLPRSPTPQVQPQVTPKLFKTSAVKIGSASLSPPAVSQPHAEIWRSETFIQITIYFWLSELRSPEDNLPKESHLRVVRNMIKHIHYFVNNFHNDGSAIDELRKICHSLYRRPIYTFLRRNIHHWPLDSSFLLMLETYLSFIQPWRYVKYNVRNREESSVVEQRWYNFIVENFPAYTVLLREIIPRFLRMDLTSPKHAHMLYRLSKVLSLPKLTDYLREIESCLEETKFGNDTAYLSPGQYRSPKSSSPGCPYKPLFDCEFRAQIHEFLINVQRSLILVQDWLNSSVAQQKMKKSGLLQSLKECLFWTGSVDDYTIEERRKTATYLEVSRLLLSSAFEIPLPELLEGKANSADKSTSTSGIDLDATRQMSGLMENLMLDPKIWRKRTKLIRYDANPDMEPIRSTEITFLVRFFHQISTRINELYGERFKQLWNRTDIWGLVAKQLLAPPCRYHYFDKSVPGNFARRVSVELPPRISLRALASHQTISYFFLSGLLAFLYRYPIIPFYFFVFFLYIFLLFLKALMLYVIGSRREAPAPEPFVPLDVSFNE
ncbi:UNVERIFIED_CONTAM: hypothetical protein PYX00_005408 [Menopon gallinae]|uniref:Sphingomyelin phosphodiesterase 4 n=1 Tax=Menopon gallinae TaxID=328185 RepID=A0AAW2HR84_9NEOP